MLETIYQVLAKKKGNLKAEIEKLEDIDFDKYQKQWVDKEFQPSGSIIGAEDGSSNFIRYKNFVLYAISTNVLYYDSKIHQHHFSDISIQAPNRFFDERIRRYMGIHEIKNTLNIIGKTDLFMMDQSLMGDIIRPHGYDMYLSPQEIESAIKMVTEMESYEGGGLASSELSRRIQGKNKALMENFLEYLEYLLWLRRLLEEGSEKLIAISKTSHSTEYFPGENMPDMTGFQISTRKSGHSVPLDIKISTKVKRRFPIFEDYFRGLEFTMFYARIDDKKAVYRFEIPKRVNIDEVNEYISRIKANCVGGYPYLLKKAHNTVAISNKDMETIARSLGIRKEKWRIF